jgi:hypothetical protein
MTALVIYDRELTGDMRVGAIRIIEDYMSLYAEE